MDYISYFGLYYGNKVYNLGQALRFFWFTFLSALGFTRFKLFIHTVLLFNLVKTRFAYLTIKSFSL